MSCNVMRVGIRGYIPKLDNASRKEALEYFRKHIGEPTYVDEFEDQVDGFEYDSGEYKYSPVEALDDPHWGIQYLFVDCSEEDNEDSDLNINLQELLDISAEMLNKFPDVSNVIFFSYLWYNGGDEPVILNLKKEST